MPQISVIVPVYNVEPYLRRCVDSILGQTFTDFELILVDDGSPDNCPAICDEYALKDSRVHVIHQENGGLSAARNAGIDWAFANSDSQWLSFVDSDDWVHPEMLERLLNAAVENNVAVSICGYAKTKGEEPELSAEDLIPKIWSPENFFIEHNINATIACGKLYHRECFQIIRYPVGKIHEDEFTTYKILFSLEKITVISAPMYNYYQNTNGIMSSVWSPARLDRIAAYEERIPYFKNLGSQQLYQIAIEMYISGVWSALDEISKSKLYAKQLKKEYHRKLINSIVHYRKELNDSIKEEICSRFWDYIRHIPHRIGKILFGPYHYEQLKARYKG